MRTLQQANQRVRTAEVDALRGAALLGICIVNVPFLAGVDMFLPPATVDDRIATSLVELLFQGKFFILFSFLFGWGFAIQLAAAERTKRDFRRAHLRRLAGLLAIGVAHALLVFIGDILVLYAILGLALLPMRSSSPRRLMQVAACLIGLSIVSLACLGIILSEPLPNTDDVSGYMGTFSDTVRQRMAEWPYAFGFMLLFNGSSALAAFCAGLAAAKTGFFELGAWSYTALKGNWIAILLAGLVLNTCYMLALDGVLGDGLLALFGFAGLAIGGPCLSSIYLIAVVELVRRGWINGVVAPGRMSLTAYVGEGVLAGLIFNGYGLGYFGEVGPLDCLVIALGIYIAIHLFSVAWLSWQRHGPLEVILRYVTKGGSANQSA